MLSHCYAIMPGLPLLARETTNLGSNCSCSRAVHQMCRQDSRVHLSPEEAIAAEESLSIYCKPVELYNIIQRRALRNPSFLQRCLHYKIQARHKRRLLLSISLSESQDDGTQTQNVFPLYVLLARLVSDIGDPEQHSVVYRLSRACVLSAFSEFGRTDQTAATFIIPELEKLSVDAKAHNLTILFVRYGETANSSSENNAVKDHHDLASIPSKLGGYCLWGKLAMESLYTSWENRGSLSLGHRAELVSTIDMHSSFVEPNFLGKENFLKFQIQCNAGSMNSLRQVQVNICAQEVGVKDRSPYDSYTYDDVPSASLAHIIRLRTGNVIFNYRYYNNTLQKTEVTEDFSCPFCLVKCASFKGLRYHLTSSHDLFNFEFWVTEEYQAVNVSVKTDIWRSEIVKDGVDPRLLTFFYCSKPRKRRISKHQLQNAKRVHPHAMKVDSHDAARKGSHGGGLERDAGTSPFHMPIKASSKDAQASNAISLQRFENDGGSNKDEDDRSLKSFLRENHLQSGRHKSECGGPENPFVSRFIESVASSSNNMGISSGTVNASAGNECGQLASGNNLAPPAMLHFARTRKLSADRGDPRNRHLLQKRQFFHSHRAQPMTLDEVLSDQDSEDEVDDDIADFEDRRLLDDFVDVTKDEKQIMHLWNSFIRKQRVLADGHIPWACEAFSRLHGRDLVHAPALIWCWRLFMIKLWNHSLLDARTINNCNLILESFQKENLGSKES